MGLLVVSILVSAKQYRVAGEFGSIELLVPSLIFPVILHSAFLTYFFCSI